MNALNLRFTALFQRSDFGTLSITLRHPYYRGTSELRKKAGIIYLQKFFSVLNFYSIKNIL